MSDNAAAGQCSANSGDASVIHLPGNIMRAQRCETRFVIEITCNIQDRYRDLDYEIEII